MKVRSVRILAIAVCLLLCLFTQAAAGPNAGGTLVVHEVDLEATTDCAAGAPATCAQADARIDGHDEAAWRLYAAFPDGSSPRLMGVTFAVLYEPGIAVTGHGSCGDFELSDEGWPASGTGSTVAWNVAQLGLLTPICWFLGYNESGPAYFRSMANQYGGYFGDDSIPALLDPIAGFSSLGFDADGNVVCPGPPALGACCTPDGCEMRLASDCVSYYYPGGPCDPDPCPAYGACCVDGGCTELYEPGCLDQGGEFLGAGTDCWPYPVPCQTGACCLANGGCAVLTPGECAAQLGSYQGWGVPCDPDPCPPPTPAERVSWGRIKSGYR